MFRKLPKFSVAKYTRYNHVVAKNNGHTLSCQGVFPSILQRCTTLAWGPVYKNSTQITAKRLYKDDGLSYDKGLSKVKLNLGCQILFLNPTFNILGKAEKKVEKIKSKPRKGLKISYNTAGKYKKFIGNRHINYFSTDGILRTSCKKGSEKVDPCQAKKKRKNAKKALGGSCPYIKEECRKGGKKAKGKKSSCKKLTSDPCNTKKKKDNKKERCKKAVPCKTKGGKKSASKKSGSDPCSKAIPCKTSSGKKKSESCVEKMSKKKSDPCATAASKRKSDPCAKAASKKKSDPCAKSASKKRSDPCATSASKKKSDPCADAASKKKSDPCAKFASKKKSDPCATTASKKKSDMCAEQKKSDPCAKAASKRKSDPCAKAASKKKSDPCAKASKRKSDPCAKAASKKKSDPCAKAASKKKSDPCAKRKSVSCVKKGARKGKQGKKGGDQRPICPPRDDTCKKPPSPYAYTGNTAASSSKFECKPKDKEPCQRIDPCKKDKGDPCKPKEKPKSKKEDPCEQRGNDPCKRKPRCK